MADRNSSRNPERRLADVIRKVKIAAAERDDVVIDIREADRVRLELLVEELRQVIADVPREAEIFDFTVSSGTQPRFWIDAVAHVHMAQDRRTYRLVRDTRLGRVVIAEDSSPETMADAVSRYIGERLVERERYLDGDMEEVRAFYKNAKDERPASEPMHPETADEVDQLPPMTVPPRQGTIFIVGLLWFILGCVAGAGVLALAFWDKLAATVS